MSGSGEMRKHMVGYWAGGTVVSSYEFTDGELLHEKLVEATIENTKGTVYEIYCRYAHNALLTYDVWWFKMQRKIEQGEI